MIAILGGAVLVASERGRLSTLMFTVWVGGTDGIVVGLDAQTLDDTFELAETGEELGVRRFAGSARGTARCRELAFGIAAETVGAGVFFVALDLSLAASDARARVQVGAIRGRRAANRPGRGVMGRLLGERVGRGRLRIGEGGRGMS